MFGTTKDRLSGKGDVHSCHWLVFGFAEVNKLILAFISSIIRQDVPRNQSTLMGERSGFHDQILHCATQRR
ncbi:MAG: hypothetical protein LBU70_03585 [Chitinispirillales bacterium]|jgi:hypothetical protein|nr:hypothetical protein [Chitinispirillales bacterium]